MRFWYVRRGVPWTPLLACSATALLATLLVLQWPGAAGVFLPVALASCTAAAAFVFDESSVTVVAVTPRGAWWRRTSRLAVTAVPLAVWLLVLALVPTQGLDHRGWFLVGAGCIVVAAGVAGLLSRRLQATPGAAVSALLVGLLMTPIVIGPMAGWEPLLPQGDFPSWLLGFWAGVAVLGLAAVAAVLRPGPR